MGVLTGDGGAGWVRGESREGGRDLGEMADAILRGDRVRLDADRLAIQDAAQIAVERLREALEASEAEVGRLREAVGGVLAWCEEMRGYCRPLYLADASDDVLDEKRGPCAAYGAVVYGLVVAKLKAALGEEA